MAWVQDCQGSGARQRLLHHPWCVFACVPDAEGALVTRSASAGGGWQSRGRDALQQPGGRGCRRLSPPAAEGISDCPGMARQTEAGRPGGSVAQPGTAGRSHRSPAPRPGRPGWAAGCVGANRAEDVCPSPRLCQCDFALRGCF